jgi:hypothetical protein
MTIPAAQLAVTPETRYCPRCAAGAIFAPPTLPDSAARLPSDLPAPRQRTARRTV